MSSNSRELSELGGIISSDAANNQLVIATGIRFPDNTVQTTAGVAVDQYARTTANVATDVNAYQNTQITYVNQFAAAAFEKANTGGSGGGLAGWTVLDNNFTVSNNIQIIANTTVAGFTITLPASPVVGNTVVITDGSIPTVGWGNNAVTIARNGKTILGYADNLVLNVSRSTATLVYDGGTWQVSSSVGPKGDVGPAGPIGNTGPQGAGVNATQQTYRFNATNNQTIFVGADAYSQTLSYNVNAISVYLNGVYLRQTEDYFANNGTSITLTSGTLANDALDVITFQSMSLTAAQNTITTYVYTASAGQTSFGGSDINGNSLNYNTNNLFVTLNGLTLRSGVDYLQSNSSYIALTAGAVANDELSIVAFGSFALPGTANTISNYSYTTTAGQTTISGADSYGNTLTYNGGNLIVTRNGSTLRNRLDYTALNGTSIILANPAYANDEIGVVTFTSFITSANTDYRYLSKIADDVYTGNITSIATGYFQVPQGTTAQRPSATTAGLIRFNTSLNTLESANGTAWSNVGSGGASSAYSANTTATDFLSLPQGTTAQRPANAANGAIRWNTSNNWAEMYTGNATGWSVIAYGGLYTVNYLVVAGGGGGGGSTTNNYARGGGGAGGLLNGTTSLIPGTSYSITVGSGGGVATNGGNSSLATIVTALGGGAGGAQNSTQSGGNGGSGGGGAGEGNAPSNNGGSGTTGQGSGGGWGTYNGPTAAGGGGGAGGSGGNGNTSAVGGAGGLGIAISSAGITGSFAGGGGGGGGYSTTSGTGGSGGTGGGGAGSTINQTATTGTSNSGGGGGGSSTGGTSGSGGSGIVVITYLSPVQRATGGTVTSSGGYYIHTFTTSGTFVA